MIGGSGLYISKIGFELMLGDNYRSVLMGYFFIVVFVLVFNFTF
mgnify:CR=1 FL=1